MYSGIFMYSVLPTYLRLGGKGVKDSIYNFFSLNEKEKKNIFWFLAKSLLCNTVDFEGQVGVTTEVKFTIIPPNSNAFSNSPGVSHEFPH